MGTTQKAERTIVLLPPALKEEARKLAAAEEMSLSALTRRALRKYVEAVCGKPSK